MTVITSKGQVYQTPNYSKLWYAKLWCLITLAIIWYYLFRGIKKFTCLIIGHRIIWNFHVDVEANTSSSWEYCKRCEKRWEPGKSHHKYFSWR